MTRMAEKAKGKKKDENKRGHVGVKARMMMLGCSFLVSPSGLPGSVRTYNISVEHSVYVRKYAKAQLR